MSAVLSLLLAGAALAQEMDHSMMHHHHQMPESAAALKTREASGTSWQPASTPHEGLHESVGAWTLMAHGFAQGIYDRQGGKRGGEKSLSTSMLMVHAGRPVGGASLALRAMVSLDPAMGPSGYPLLLQSGETGDGRTTLIDRQHPHDFLMELSARLDRSWGERGGLFLYAGWPGEPALGPPAFMHRFSGVDDPAAPIAHHWLDSTHISMGVVTGGLVWGDWKLEASGLRGREPDRFRWDLEEPRLDSFASRLSINPTDDWALQASYGDLHRPEALEPEIDQRRLTASASRNWRALGAFGQATLAWGRNFVRPGPVLDAFLLEAAARWPGGHTIFARAERVDKDELIEGTAQAVLQLRLGYVYDFARWRRTSWGAGVSASISPVRSALRDAYGRAPGALMVFARVKLL
jgi:hypothetical protein